MSTIPWVECHRVAKVLQAYLDGEVDHMTADMVSTHLETCRRCGLEANTYRAIKAATLGAESEPAPVDPDAVARLRRFAEGLSREES
ncbi:MAG TPA: zf-HC2 domain-containing protein [Arachnia sp.]|nr:zf-HC2 domain-containing protein [Arachnia sp.]